MRRPDLDSGSDGASRHVAAKRWRVLHAERREAMGFSNKESVLVDQLQTFADGIVANPPLYQLSTPDSVLIQNTVDAFLAARVVANNPATRNVGSIDDKQAKKSSALGVCRSFYR